MKRKLALFLVLALVLSLVPANVFAATSNSVNKVPTVADDYEFTAADAPLLRIEEDTDGEFNGETQTFTLALTNAEWDEADEALIEAADTATEVITATYISATKMQIALATIDGDLTDADFVRIPLVAELQGEGEAKVTIDAKDSAVTGGTYTFAKGAGGSTTASIDDTTTFGDTVEIENIVIEENVIDTFSDVSTEITLKITNGDFDWDITGANYDITFSGGFNPAAGVVDVASDNELTLTITNIYPGAAGTTRGTITIEGLKINPASDADFGDVMVKVYGDDVTSETLTVGKYSDYTITVEADDEEADLPVLYAGDLDDIYVVRDKDALAFDTKAEIMADVEAKDGEDNEVSLLVIEEEVEESWVLSRETEIEFPDWVKIIDIDVVTADNFDGTNDTAAEIEAILDYEPGDSSVTFNGLAADAGQKVTLELQFYVSVEADQKGDVVATVKGKAVGDEFKATLAKAVAPITATYEVKDVKIGVQDQATGKVTVTEYEEGVLDDGNLAFEVDSDIDFSATPDSKVTKGDLAIDEVDEDANVVTVTIDQDSSEASTFELTGFEVDVDRTVPEGDFNMTIGGSAIVKNYEEDADWFAFDTDSVVDAKYVRVITPAPGDTKAGEKVVFTIGAADYMVGAAKMTSDAAPYINEQGRTMLPLRALANALGVTDTNIMWNEVERSVTIFKGDATIKVVIGQMSFVKNGVAVPMDTMAVINNGRTMLPLRAIGQALGAEVLWDEATRTVTVQ